MKYVPPGSDNRDAFYESIAENEAFKPKEFEKRSLDLSKSCNFVNTVGNGLNFSGFNTMSIRSGYKMSEYGEHSEAIFETSSYVYSSCLESYKKFSGIEEGFVYSRFTNPTVRTFEKKMSILEAGEDAIATASGMSAILTTFVALLKSGDRLVCSANVFGSTRLLINNFLKKFGVEVSFVNLLDYDSWDTEAKRSDTKLFFLETPANPTLEVIDLSRLEDVISGKDIILVVDNTICSPCSQRPLLMGANIVIHSTSKYIDGHGRCIGGAIVGSKRHITDCRAFMRCAGPSMTAHNAWIFSKGLETLDLRMERHSRNACTLAHWLQDHPKVKKVFYPGLESHPQHLIAKRQQKYFGGLVSFELHGSKGDVWKCMDKAQLCSLTTNIGDAKTMITHPATTTHVKLTDEERRRVGISETLVRVSVGLENIEDIIEDLSQCFL